MGMLESLFGQVAGTIVNHSSPNTPGPAYDANPLLGALQGMFSQHAADNGQQFDPGTQYGNGGNQGNVLPASQDPYGDPADQPGGGQFGNVLPASQDPYGDPADQERR